MNLSKLYGKQPYELLNYAKEIGLSNMPHGNRQEIISAILKAKNVRKEDVVGSGVLEVMQDGFGFLRSETSGYITSPDDIYVSSSQIRRFDLRTGDTVEGRVRAPKEGERYFALLKVETINEVRTEDVKPLTQFKNLTPLHAEQKFQLTRNNGSERDITSRIIDIVAPIGKGQRGLIVSPPKAGKTIILQNIADSLATNHPKCKLFVLLIDERPEEVTEMQRTVVGEVISSTFDELPSRHVHVAQMVIEKTKRLVEQGHNVVILLDSITRLARAYNTVAPVSGRVLSGGVDSQSLHKPKRFFGAARNVENGGSLTIIATALIDTGSRMDDVIYEEFKGTGNMELHLDRALANRRIYPAINIRNSGTRREELMTGDEELKKIWVLRRLLSQMEDGEAMNFLIGRMKNVKTNADFFTSMKK